MGINPESSEAIFLSVRSVFCIWMLPTDLTSAVGCIHLWERGGAGGVRSGHYGVTHQLSGKMVAAASLRDHPHTTLHALRALRALHCIQDEPGMDP